MKNRFDLEQEIMETWHVVDNIQLLADCAQDLNKDEMEAMLLGLAKMTHLKFDKLFQTFEQCIQSEIPGPWTTKTPEPDFTGSGTVSVSYMDDDIEAEF